MLRLLFFVFLSLFIICVSAKGELDPFRNVPDKIERVDRPQHPGGGRGFPAFGANGLPGVQPGLPGGARTGQVQGGFPGQGGFQGQGGFGGQGQGGFGGQGGFPGQGGSPGQGGFGGAGQGQGGFGKGQGGMGQGGRPPSTPILNTEIGYQYSNTCYVPYQRETCAPHFIIAGAMKTGTTSMFSYLLNHPNILPLKSDAQLNGRPILANKEIRFFNDPVYTQMVKSYGITSAINQYFDVFPNIDKDWNIITGESSPMYIVQKEVAARIKAALPFVKVIILLRDPIDRAYSEHWFKFSLAPDHKFDQQRQHALFELCTRREINLLKYCNIDQFLHASVTPQLIAEFESCYFPKLKLLRSTLPDHSSCKEGGDNFGLCIPELSLPDNGVPYGCNEMGVKISLYALQLVEWVKHFDSDQLLILDSKEFFDDPSGIMTQVIDFLGVSEDGFDWDFVDGKAYNIVNPGKKGQYNLPTTLSIGQDTSASLKEKYPPITPEFRQELEEFFRPYNQLLAQTIKKKNFWHY